MISRFLSRNHLRRKLRNVAACILLGVATVAALAPLISIFGYILSQGVSSLDWEFFTQLPKPVGENGGGIANALVGTVILVFLGCWVGVPWGIATGIYLSEYRGGRLGTLVRFGIDLLASIPSIIIGLFVYELLVVPMKRFSALSGGVALGILMIPTIARTTEEILKLVPDHLREAGLALGIPRWKTTLFLILRGSLSAITTGVMLAIARVAGESAPLLFTAFNNRFWHQGLDQPIASIPIQIFNYAISPFEEWHRHAWAAALVLVAFVFTMNLGTRMILRSPGRSRD